MLIALLVAMVPHIGDLQRGRPRRRRWRRWTSEFIKFFFFEFFVSGRHPKGAAPEKPLSHCG